MQRGILVLLLTFGVVVATVAGLATGKVTLVLAAVGAPALLGLALVEPRGMVGMTVVSHGFAYALPVPGSITTFKLIFLVMVLSTALHVWRRGHLRPVPRVLVGVLVTLLVWRVLRNIVSPMPGISLSLFGHVLSIGLILFTSQVVTCYDDLVVLCRALALGALATGLAFLAEWLEARDSWSIYSRLSGPSGNANSSAANAARLLLMTLPLALVDRRLLWRGIGAAGVVACVYGIYMTASRGVSLPLPVALLLFAALAAARVVTRVYAVTIVAILSVALIAAAPESFTRRISSTVETSSTGQVTSLNTSSRVELAQLALEMIAERPLAGHGEGAFQARNAMVTGGHGIVPHNVYLNVAVSFGLPFALVFTLLVIGSGALAAWLALTIRGPPRVFLAALVAVVVLDMITSTSAAGMFHGAPWAIIGIVHVLHDLVRQPIDESERRSASPGYQQPVRPLPQRAIPQPVDLRR